MSQSYYPRGNLPYRGPRGGDASRGGRGDGGRGGRGRGGGHEQGAENALHELFQSVPEPSNSVTTLENGFIKKSQGARAQQGELALRPGYGTAGKAITLRANYFNIDFKPDVKYYVYAVNCEPDPSPKRIRLEIFQKLLKVPIIAAASPATDGAQELVTMIPLGSLSPIRIAIGTNSEKKTFVLSLTRGTIIKPQKVLDALRNDNLREQIEDEATAVRVMNTVMGAVPFRDPRVLVKGRERNKIVRIDDKKQAHDLTGGIESLRSYYSSVRLGGGRVLLNLNVNHGAYYCPGPLVDLIEGFKRVFGENRSLLHRYVKTMRVMVTHLPKVEENGGMAYRQRTIWGVAQPSDGADESDNPPRVRRIASSAKNVEFFEEEKDRNGKPTGKGKYITVADYFKKTYDITLQYPDVPVVNIGNNRRPIYLPAEVCEIPFGQSFSGELGTSQRQQMIQFSCRKPPLNWQSIMQEGKELVGITDNMIMPWGMRPAQDMITVPARVLNGPSLKYGNRSVEPRDGSWNLRDLTFCQGGTVGKWSGLLIQRRNDRQEDPAKCLQALQSMSAKMGVKWGPISMPYNRIVIDDREPKQWMPMLLNIFQKIQGTLSFVVIMLPAGVDRVFEYIKYLGDIRFGILTHCVLTQKFMKDDMQYYANNAMKINLKFGGVCQSLKQPHRLVAGGTTMVVGLDVTHPSPTDFETYPSLAGIVASIDGRLGQWPGEIRVQNRRQEKIEHLKDMMLGRLHRWKHFNKKELPNNILIFRDGVSEGQFKMILQEELPQVKDAVRAIYKSSPPNITVLVVGKRHNVRFYPTNSRDMNQRTQNCLPGTIVDRGVTRPIYWDWYLQAQAPIQGSGRPAHYVVIYDEIYGATKADSNATDSLQDLTNSICYLMGRCTRSISYCTPAFLADRFCDRARKYVRAYYSEREARGERVSGERVIPPTQKEVTLHDKAREMMVYI